MLFHVTCMSRVYFQHSIADFSHSGPQIHQSALGLNETAELYDKNIYFHEILCIIVVDLVVLNNRCLLSHTFFPGPQAFCKKAVERVNSEKNILNR